jgi:hypothetical protein
VTLFAANDPFGGLIGLIIFVAIAAISHFLKRKQGGQDDTIPDTDEDELAPPVRRSPSAPQSAGRQLSWEEELKRLLEGQTPVEPPAPPPVVIVQREAPAPEPVWAEPEPEPAPVFARRELPPVFSRTGPTEESESHELHEVATGHMAKLREAASAHERASQLGATIRDRVDAAELLAQQRTAAQSATHRSVKRSPEIESVVALLRQPRTARQVFIASTVFGQPKALADA